MRFLLIAILLVSIILAGCASVKTYTFKKDRVDQRVEGNRGYLMGTPPPTPIVRGLPKRTLIGIDMEIDILPGEEVPTIEETPAEEATIEPAMYEPEEEVVEEEVVEEEWIK